MGKNKKTKERAKRETRAALEGATIGTDSTPSNRDADTTNMDDAAHRASSDGSGGEEDALVVEVAAGDRYAVVAAKVDAVDRGNAVRVVAATRAQLSNILGRECDSLRELVVAGCATGMVEILVESVGRLTEAERAALNVCWATKLNLDDCESQAIVSSEVSILDLVTDTSALSCWLEAKGHRPVIMSTETRLGKYGVEDARSKTAVGWPMPPSKMAEAAALAVKDGVKFSIFKPSSQSAGTVLYLSGKGMARVPVCDMNLYGSVRTWVGGLESDEIEDEDEPAARALLKTTGAASIESARGLRDYNFEVSRVVFTASAAHIRRLKARLCELHQYARTKGTQCLVVGGEGRPGFFVARRASTASKLWEKATGNTVGGGGGGGGKDGGKFAQKLQDSLLDLAEGMRERDAEVVKLREEQRGRDTQAAIDREAREVKEAADRAAREEAEAASRAADAEAVKARLDAAEARETAARAALAERLEQDRSLRVAKEAADAAEAVARAAEEATRDIQREAELAEMRMHAETTRQTQEAAAHAAREGFANTAARMDAMAGTMGEAITRLTNLTSGIYVTGRETATQLLEHSDKKQRALRGCAALPARNAAQPNRPTTPTLPCTARPDLMRSLALLSHCTLDSILIPQHCSTVSRAVEGRPLARSEVEAGGAPIQRQLTSETAGQLLNAQLPPEDGGAARDEESSGGELQMMYVRNPERVWRYRAAHRELGVAYAAARKGMKRK